MTSHDTDWFTNDDFWETSFAYMFSDDRFDAAGGELDAILALAGGAPQRVLDMACGPGRHAIVAAERGLEVVGVDRSAFLLRHARDRAAESGVEVEWTQGDMRDYVQAPPVDLVLNVFTSFGYFEDDAENARVLENAFASLRPGGTLVLDVAGKEVLARIFLPSSADELAEGLVVQRRHVTDDWCRMENEWTFVQGETVRSFQFRHWIYSGRELAQMLRRAGFADVRLYGDFDGAPYGPEATRLVAVAQRA